MPHKNHKALVQRSKERAFNECGGLCHYCGEPMILRQQGKSHDNPLYASWDHIIPSARGGDNSNTNLILCHKFCNERKAALPYEIALATKPWELSFIQWKLLVKQSHASATGHVEIMRHLPETCSLCGILEKKIRS